MFYLDGQTSSSGSPQVEQAKRHVPYTSASKQMEARFRERRPLRKFVGIFYILVTAIYLVWRFTIINETSLFLSWTYFVAECFGYVLGLTTIFCSWEYRHREVKPAPGGLAVDVFVLTYKEPLDVIRKTAVAARQIEYPHKTWLLDDGNRPEIKQLASSLGIRYRARGNNVGAKAGNINFGLAQSRGDFVAVFDADHIAKPHCLDVMLGFFTDSAVALVQAPQDYYNVDAFQYMNPRRRPGLWHDQSFFYNIAQPGRDVHNAASCVGTSVVYRRTALEAIGGIPQDTVTEDIHTSLKLHKRGFKTVYLNESIAYGIAAADLAEYYKTRHRWGHGNLETLRIENVLFCKGLTLAQRLSYLTLGLIYLEGWQQLMLFIVPILALLFGLAPFNITIFNVLVVLGFPILSYLLLQELGCGFSRYWTNEIFAMARWPIHILATAGLFGWRLPWRTSAKNVKGRLNWRLMAPQISVLLLSLVAVGVAVVRLFQDFEVGPLGQAVVALTDPRRDLRAIDIYADMPEGYSIDLVIIASFWALFNAARAAHFVVKTVSNANSSHAFHRFKLSLPVALPQYAGKLVQSVHIAEDHIKIALPASLERRIDDRGLDLEIFLPGEVLSVRVAVANRGPGWLEGAFDLSDASTRDRLSACLYSVNWHREFQVNVAYFLTPLDWLLRLVGRGNRPAPAADAWEPLLLPLDDRGASSPLLIADRPHRLDRASSVISFADLQPGRSYRARWVSRQGPYPVAFTVLGKEPISSLPNKGFDGVVYNRYKAEFMAGDTGIETAAPIRAAS